MIVLRGDGRLPLVIGRCLLSTFDWQLPLVLLSRKCDAGQFLHETHLSFSLQISERTLRMTQQRITKRGK